MKGELPPLVAIVGPTATGKSSLAVAVAHALGGPDRVEIVSGDAYQLYRGMSIGTAAMTMHERQGIVHHLVGVVDPQVDLSVAQYQRDARAAIQDVEMRGKRAILVGGSGLYIRAVVDDMQFPGTDDAVRGELEKRAAEHGSQALFEELVARDPQAAHRMGASNERRIIRALEVITITGRPFTAFLPQATYVRPTVTIGVDCDRSVLDQRVESRVHTMISQGLEDEVRSVLQQGMGRTASRAVGYAEFLRYFDGEISRDQAVADIITHTRRLTRKQMGWFGRDSRTQWIDALSPSVLHDALVCIDRADHGEIFLSDTQPTRRRLGT